MLKSVTLSSSTIMIDIIDANFFAPLSQTIIRKAWAKPRTNFIPSLSLEA